MNEDVENVLSNLLVDFEKRKIDTRNQCGTAKALNNCVNEGIVLCSEIVKGYLERLK